MQGVGPAGPPAWSPCVPRTRARCLQGDGARDVSRPRLGQRIVTSSWDPCVGGGTPVETIPGCYSSFSPRAFLICGGGGEVGIGGPCRRPGCSGFPGPATNHRHLNACLDGQLTACPPRKHRLPSVVACWSAAACTATRPPARALHAPEEHMSFLLYVPEKTLRSLPLIFHGAIFGALSPFPGLSFGAPLTCSAPAGEQPFMPTGVGATRPPAR